MGGIGAVKAKGGGGGGVKVIGVGLDFDYCQILGGVNIRCLFLTSK